MLFLPRGNLSRLSDVFVSANVCRVCVRTRERERTPPAGRRVRPGGEVAARRKGFRRDSFYSRRITAIRVQLARRQHGFDASLGVTLQCRCHVSMSPRGSTCDIENGDCHR